jgi:multidrug resistance efflux pump
LSLTSVKQLFYTSVSVALKRSRSVILVILAVAVGAYAYAALRPSPLVLTGIVTTHDVMVSAQIPGSVARLAVQEGDTVKKDQVLAVITPDEAAADRAYYAENARGLSAQVRESEAALRFEKRQMTDRVAQAESTLAASEAQVRSAAADLEAATATYSRLQDLARQQIASAQDLDQARASTDAARAKLQAVEKQAEAQRAALAMARANAEQVALRESQLQSSRHQEAAAAAQQTKADVRLAYTEVRAPLDAIVDVRAVNPGEYVNAGQPVVTLVDPDDLWVRADVEETYIDRIRIGDTLPVRLPSGAEVQGTVFYRGADAGFATQRDVSRTKRDIRTFEIRLRVDNRERRLALGMTAYVTLPLR